MYNSANLEFMIGDKIVVSKSGDIMHGCVGKVVAHIQHYSDPPQVKVKFDFQKGQYKPRPRNFAHSASNIQFRIFDITDLVMDTKLNRLLYG